MTKGCVYRGLLIGNTLTCCIAYQRGKNLGSMLQFLLAQYTIGRKRQKNEKNGKIYHLICLTGMKFDYEGLLRKKDLTQWKVPLTWISMSMLKLKEKMGLPTKTEEKKLQ